MRALTPPNHPARVRRATLATVAISSAAATGWRVVDEAGLDVGIDAGEQRPDAPARGA